MTSFRVESSDLFGRTLWFCSMDRCGVALFRINGRRGFEFAKSPHSLRLALSCPPDLEASVLPTHDHYVHHARSATSLAVLLAAFCLRKRKFGITN